MKTIENLCKELGQNKELSNALLESLKADRVEDFLKAQNCPVSREELKACLHEMAAELPDEALEQVDGGRSIVEKIGKGAYDALIGFWDDLIH